MSTASFMSGFFADTQKSRASAPHAALQRIWSDMKLLREADALIG